MSIDNMTGYEDDYDEALKWGIEEVINEIHRIKELEQDRQESVYFALFDQEILEAYERYKEELKI